MKKSKYYIIGIALIAIISIVAVIIFNSNVIKKANIDNGKEVIASTNDKHIFGTFSMNTNWVKDPFNPENVIEMSSEYSIVKAKIVSIGEAKFLKMSDPAPYTAVEVQIEEVIEGIGNKRLKTIYVEGGETKLHYSDGRCAPRHCYTRNKNSCRKRKNGINQYYSGRG